MNCRRGLAKRVLDDAIRSLEPHVAQSSTASQVDSMLLLLLLLFFSEIFANKIIEFESKNSC